MSRFRMSVTKVLLYCTALLYSVVGQVREDGILYDHTAIGLRVWYPEQTMRNNDYPDLAPHDLVQTWRWVGMQESGEHTAIKIVCRKVFIPKNPGTNDCGDYALTVEDGDNRKELCGDVGPLTIISSTNDIKFEMHTGSNGGGIVDCTARAIPVTADRREITTTTTTTTTTPRPTMPAYMKLESEEVFSAEHGVDQGVKGTTCPCGWANKMGSFSRIVNGTETARNEFPFAAGLIYRGSRGRFCGATIISRYHALTAAHCTEGQNAQDLALLVGAHNVYEDWDGPVDEVPIEQIAAHAQYTRGVWLNDIALLTMEREIKFSQYVGPACLPPVSPPINEKLDRQYIKIIGWGAGVFKGAQSPVLKKVNVRVVPMNECNYMYNAVKVTNPTQICTYALRKASCQGDSGGPVMWVDPETNRYTHVGIVSFGRICGDISPSVHTSVQAYLGWIHSHIKDSNKPNSQTCTKVN